MLTSRVRNLPLFLLNYIIKRRIKSRVKNPSPGLEAL